MASTPVVLQVTLIALFTVLLHRAGPSVSTITRLPSITIFLLVGVLCRVIGLMDMRATSAVLPLHQAALAMITFAAGSELELTSLRRNARVVMAITCCLTATAVTFVFTLGLILPALVSSDADSDVLDNEHRWRRRAVASMLASVVAIARSPSSAIGVVSELQADGPFTQCMLTVTMVTDVVVIVLFTAAVEMADVLLSPFGDAALSRVVFRFAALSAVHLTLSVLHATALTGLCLLALRLPARIAVLRPLALLAVGGFAFGTERLLHQLLHGAPLDQFIRLEPMLGCILAGFALCNFCGVRRRFGEVLKKAMPLVLVFFFITTGLAIDLDALAHSWPAACGLFAARLVSIRAGYALGTAWAPVSTPEVMRSQTAWLALITQAGVGLGLAEEIGDRFAPWAEGLRTNIVGAIVLSQILGPPLLRHALRMSGEAGRSVPQDYLVDQLTKTLGNNPKAAAAITAASRAAADSFSGKVIAAPAGVVPK